MPDSVPNTLNQMRRPTWWLPFMAMAMLSLAAFYDTVQECVATAYDTAQECVATAWREFSPHGLRVTYYAGTEFQKKITKRTEWYVYRDYADWSVPWNVPAKGFSARWDGQLVIPEEADYVFIVKSSDGTRIYLDGQCVLDNWRVQAWGKEFRKVTAHLSRGKHRIVIEHFSAEGPGGILVEWVGGPLERSALGVPYLTRK